MTIRPYAASDRAACIAVFDANVPEAFSVEERDEFVAFLDALPGPYSVVEDDTGVIGCGGWAFEEDGATVSLCWGMITPARQGERLGRALLQSRVQDALTDPRCRSFRLGTAGDTAPFFEKLGFQVVERTPDGIGPGRDAVEMVWSRPDS